MTDLLDVKTFSAAPAPKQSGFALWGSQQVPPLGKQLLPLGAGGQGDG